MALSSNAQERNSRRTLSEYVTTNEDAEEDKSRRRHVSESMQDLRSIEAIVTCAIHLGIMDNPRKLHCQHSFCTHCLISLAKINGTLCCPVCRAIEPHNDVMSIPQALVERQLIEVVMNHRISECTSQSTSNHSPLSKEGKEELVKHLLTELKNTSSAIFKFNELSDTTTSSGNRNVDGELTLQTRLPSATSSTYDMMDVETIRENMLKQSCYEDVKHNSIKKVFKHYPLRKHCKTEPNVKTFDIHRLGDESDNYEIVFVDSITDKFYVYSSYEFRSFFIYLDGVVLRPVYLRILRDDIFVTGVISESGDTFSLFVQSNMHGKIIRKSDRYRHSQFNISLPMLAGFDVDERNEKYFVCTPFSNSVQVYNTSLVDCRQRYDFENQKPEFVTFYHHQNQLWVSCPDNRRILIADADSGAFMMFRTDQINEAIPNMIYCTDNERIIFLDSRSSRFIWIKRRGDYILTQKLHFRSISEDWPINAFQVLPGSLVVIGTVSDFLVFQPVKVKSRIKSGLTSCALL